jgi:hypothetical protein
MRRGYSREFIDNTDIQISPKFLEKNEDGLWSTDHADPSRASQSRFADAWEGRIQKAGTRPGRSATTEGRGGMKQCSLLDLVMIDG